MLNQETSPFNAEAVDPDRSNPTRHRLERPLDTIRAFEAAIDGAHDRRAFARTGTRKTLLGDIIMPRKLTVPVSRL